MEHIKAAQGLKSPVCRQSVLVGVERAAYLGAERTAFFRLSLRLSDIPRCRLGARQP